MLGTNAFDIVGVVQSLIGVIVPVLISLAVLVFLYGVFQFITSAGDEEKRKKGKQFIMWGLIGLFVMVSVWGLVNVLINTFMLDTRAPIGGIEGLIPLYCGNNICDPGESFLNCGSDCGILNLFLRR